MLLLCEQSFLSRRQDSNLRFHLQRVTCCPYTTAHLIHLSRWSSVLISSHLPILCRSFAHFGYLLTRGRVFSMATHSADTLQASVGMVSAPTAGSIFALLAGVVLPAIEPLTSMGGGYSFVSAAGLAPAYLLCCSRQFLSLCVLSTDSPVRQLIISYEPKVLSIRLLLNSVSHRSATHSILFYASISSPHFSR